jgi:energy-coupling factor transporter ATP-binding protein EcfA2
LINPFIVTGRESSDEPLVPWRYPGDADYYVEIDGVQQAFEAFQAFADWKMLRSSGSLVLVTGPPGCGKTSLINRCLHWLSEEVRGEPRDVVILDLTGVARTTLPLAQRLSLVTDRLVLEGRERGFDSEDGIGGLARPSDAPEEVLARYAEYLQRQEDTMVAVLLPEVELQQELEVFAQIAVPGLIFFTESGFSAITDGAPRTTMKRRVLHLRVGPLKAGDASSFVRARLGDRAPHAASEITPAIDSTALEALIAEAHQAGAGISIGFLQRLLTSIWEKTDSNPPNTAQINRERLLQHLMKMASSDG